MKAATEVSWVNRSGLSSGIGGMKPLNDYGEVSQYNRGVANSKPRWAASTRTVHDRIEYEARSAS